MERSPCLWRAVPESRRPQCADNAGACSLVFGQCHLNQPGFEGGAEIRSDKVGTVRKSQHSLQFGTAHLSLEGSDQALNMLGDLLGIMFGGLYGLMFRRLPGILFVVLFGTLCGRSAVCGSMNRKAYQEPSPVVVALEDRSR